MPEGGNGNQEWLRQMKVFQRSLRNYSIDCGIIIFPRLALIPLHRRLLIFRETH
jgi:hypothetical protein